MHSFSKYYLCIPVLCILTLHQYGASSQYYYLVYNLVLNNYNKYSSTMHTVLVVWSITNTAYSIVEPR